MPLGDILKGTAKVVGTVGLLIIGGVASAATKNVEANGGDSTILDELAESCGRKIDEIWGDKLDDAQDTEMNEEITDNEPETPEEAARREKQEAWEEYTRSAEKIKIRKERTQSAISKYSSLMHKAKNAGNEEAYLKAQEMMEQAMEHYRELEQEESDIFLEYHKMYSIFNESDE